MTLTRILGVQSIAEGFVVLYVTLRRGVATCLYVHEMIFQHSFSAGLADVLGRH